MDNVFVKRNDEWVEIKTMAELKEGDLFCMTNTDLKDFNEDKHEIFEVLEVFDKDDYVFVESRMVKKNGKEVST